MNDEQVRQQLNAMKKRAAYLVKTWRQEAKRTQSRDMDSARQRVHELLDRYLDAGYDPKQAFGAALTDLLTKPTETRS